MPNIHINRRVVVSRGADEPQTLAFLSRTSGLDATHINAYKTFLNGIVRDGLFNKFDALYLLATQNSTTALLNLISTSFGLAEENTPTFAADAGYTGTNNGNKGLDTGFNPTSATSPKFTQNAAHVSIFSNTSAASSGSGGCALGLAGTGEVSIFPRYEDGNAYLRTNDSPSSAGFTNGNGTGHYLSNRSSSSAQQNYKNASDQGIASQTSGTVGNDSIRILCFRSGGSNQLGSAHQICAASIGGSLTSGEVTLFYNRLRTYLTTMGVP